MMAMLRGLVDDGWQILYFSAKREVADALAADIRDGRVELIELEAAPPASPASTGRENGAETGDGSPQGKLALADTRDAESHSRL